MKRYAIQCTDCDPEVTLADNGMWVRYSDVERLRAENAELRQELAGERERIASMCWADRGHFASDLAALHFAELVMARKDEGEA